MTNTNLTKEIQHISKYMLDIIEREVADRVPNNDSVEISDTIEYYIDEAKQLVDNYKDDQLTFNTIEAEGYLRGCLSLGDAIRGCLK